MKAHLLHLPLGSIYGCKSVDESTLQLQSLIKENDDAKRRKTSALARARSVSLPPPEPSKKRRFEDLSIGNLLNQNARDDMDLALKNILLFFGLHVWYIHLIWLLTIFVRRKKTNHYVYEQCSWILDIETDARIIRNFIVNHSMSLAIFTKFSSLNLLGMADTRFASTIQMVERFLEVKLALESWVMSKH